MMDNNIAMLVELSNKFFQLHWPPRWDRPPGWGSLWEYQGTMPSHDLQGVYALVSRPEIIAYIGVGAAFGSGLYEGCGLGSRTARYRSVVPGQALSVNVKERKYIPPSPWNERGIYAIVTLGMRSDQAYLAYGLEAFLLAALKPEYNNRNPSRHRNA